ncbi:methyl-accepting chemotaxis protein [Photobacterium sanctipauli]|uniref:Methyl-accepting chemotaxis protein n=1 Tax=Photobacterium sanctipauli TaxID=1342794 RepID=A0A2T3NV71_9GAMM|nr:methyl-accepting chemotaxis protein [Photobacterium sanctipauli]PSW20118.1 methyl-accepting chemotaxis protein [Photobacterium sanctipauli]
MNLSIKNKLCLTFAVIILLISAIQTWLTSERLNADANRSTQQLASSLSQSTVSSINQWLSNKALITKSAVNGFNQSPTPIAELQQAMNAGGFDLVYAGKQNGDIVFSRDITIPDGFDLRHRPWYKAAMASNSTIVTMPYVDASSGELVVTLAEQFQAEHGQGVIAADTSITGLINEILSINQNGMYAMLLSGDGKVIAHPDSSLTLQDATRVSPELNQTFIKQLSNKPELTEMMMGGQSGLVNIQQIPNTDWYFTLVLDADVAFAHIDDALFNSLITTLVQLIVVIGAALVLIGRALKPLDHLADAMKDLSQGNGDLTHRLDFDNNDEIGRLGTYVNAFIEKLHKSVTGISGSTEHLSEQAKTSHDVSVKTSAALEQQVGEIAQIATAIHEMSATAQEVASHAEQTAGAAVASHKSCNDGKEVISRNQQSITYLANHVQDAASIIKELENNAQGINAILSTIQGIAEQTNLLALNAAIEAARAGEQGRGFAVVADEVRVLSQRTHSSTEEIRGMIETLQRNTHNAVETMQQSQDLATGSVEEANNATLALEAITASIQHISDMATQISSAAEEQRAVAEEISRNTQAVNDVSDQLSFEAKESQQLSQELNDIAEHLGNEVNKFKI